MNNIKFLIELRNFHNTSNLLKSETLTAKEIKKAFERDDITLEERIIIALNNNQLDVIKSLTDEQIDELINSPADMSRYDIFKDIGTKQKSRIADDKRLSWQEKLYLLRDDREKVKKESIEKGEGDVYEKDLSKYLYLLNYDDEYDYDYGNKPFEDDMLKRKRELLIKVLSILGKQERFVEVCEKYDLEIEKYGFGELFNVKNMQFLSFKEHMEYIFTLLENKENAKVKDYEDIISEYLVISPEDNIEEFKKLIDTDKTFKDRYFKNVQEHFKKVIKNLYGEDKDTVELSKIIYSMPIIQKRMVNSVSAYEVNGQKNFFDNLSYENRSLIVYYVNYSRDPNSEKEYENIMKKWYEKYFGSILTEQQQEELIMYFCKNSNGKQYTANEDRRITCEKLEYVLKQVETSPKFYKEMSDIRDTIFEGNLNDAITFTRAYSKTPLYSEILEKIKVGEISTELQEKIMYLATKNKLVGIDTLYDLEGTTMEELKNVSFELTKASDLVKSTTYGSGTGLTKKVIFNKLREIVIISADGKERYIPVGNSHEATLRSIYGEKIELPRELGIYDIVCKATKDLGDIVFVIEAETLMMYLSKDITMQQKNKFSNLIKKIENPNKVKWYATIIDGDDIFFTDYEEYKEEAIASNVFLERYTNVTENTQER